MPETEVVVSDTSPLLNLALVDRLDLVRRQFDSVLVPEAVRDELLDGEEGAATLSDLLESDLVTVVRPRRDDLVRELRSELDAGEAAAIAVGIDRGADLVLLDERDGRQVARRHDLEVTGAVGIVLRAARNDRLDIERALDELREAGFWIGDDLYRKAVEAAAADDES